MEERLKIHEDRCKGCGYCVASCPRKALFTADGINAKGYAYARVDRKKCVRCGVCYNVCPDYVFEIVKEG